MNSTKQANSLTFRRGSEVGQASTIEHNMILGGGGTSTQRRELSPFTVCHGVSGKPSVKAACNKQLSEDRKRWGTAIFLV